MSKSDTVIEVENLSKLYRIGLKEQMHDNLVGAALDTLKRPLRNLQYLRGLNTYRSNGRGAGNGKAAEEDDGLLWALRDVSFEVKRGEVLGIIGRNGAGKSTLLKILSRITEPTSGRITMRGRVSALLEVGTGFHPELTGRENIYLNGTILGMKKREIDAKFDEIVDFSGVEKFLDTPVKRYSSGMKVRLAFAVAAHLEPEILIVDEVLAVGDAEFQKKCLGKMQDVATGEGRTVLFVSHNMGAVQTLCPRALLLRAGEIVDEGQSEDVVATYLNTVMSAPRTQADEDPSKRAGDGRIRVNAVRCLNHRNEETNNLFAGKPAAFEFDYINHSRTPSAHVQLTIVNGQGVCVSHFHTRFQSGPIRLNPDSGTISCHIPDIPFPIGSYRATLIIRDGEKCDVVPSAVVFDVTESEFFPTGTTPEVRYCAVMIRHNWSSERMAVTAGGVDASVES